MIFLNMDAAAQMRQILKRERFTDTYGQPGWKGDLYNQQNFNKPSVLELLC